MFIRRRHRDVPELNTTSTADISFMLLVFFLVTSSMDTDKGLGRKLPPVEEQQQQVESFVASRQTDRHIIAVQADRHTSYNAYFEMQNAVVAAYHSLRDKMARQKYGHSFDLCTPEEREVVTARYPQRISEGVPTEQEGGDK